MMRHVWAGPGFLILFFFAASVCLWSGEAPAGEKKEELHPITVSIQGVLASKGKDPDNPVIEASLAAYKAVLTNFRFGKYDDIGRDAGTAKPNVALTLKVGSHTIEITFTAMARKGPAIDYILRSGKNEIGRSAVVLPAGEVVAVQVGDPAVPVILLFQSGRPASP
jgi:hypothetical protein